MKISDAIAFADSLFPNTYSREEKKKWLSEIDTRIYQTIISKHEGNPLSSFDGYTEETPDDTELLVREPYDELYIHYLEYKISYFDHDYSHYNAAASMFSALYNDFAVHYNQEHRPKKRKLFGYFGGSR